MGGDGIAASIQAAAERTAARWPEVQRHAGTREEAAGVVQAIGQALGYPVDLGVPVVPLQPNALSRLLVALFRRELLAAAIDPGELVGLLRRLETVALSIESSWDAHFADQLTGRDGLELVVELAHDLRSPLTSILFLAETLQRGSSGPITPVQERQLGLIYSAAFGLNAVASDVIELARGGDRLVDLDPVPFSMSDILTSVQDIVLPIAEEKDLTLQVEGPVRPFRVGHPAAINRVLLNLTTNALKYTETGSVYIQVMERPHQADLVEFVVKDTGNGMTPEAMALLFEPFRRRRRDKHYAFSGSGLGLSICRKLVEAMGSELHLESREGEGTRFAFTLTLPAAEGLE